MAVDMQQLQVVHRVLSAMGAPNAMMDLAVFLCYPQRLTANHASSGTEQEFRSNFEQEDGATQGVRTMSRKIGA